jgi:hypothetical protein
VNRGVWFAVVLSIGSAILIGCGPTSPGTRQSAGQQPSQVHPIPGTSVRRVLLTATAVADLGIRTQAVRLASAAADAATQDTVVPVAALIYAADGSAWVYLALSPTDTDATNGWLTFEREPVVVARIDGDDVVLHSGPPVGALVVIVGAAELLGTEDGVEGG